MTLSTVKTTVLSDKAPAPDLVRTFSYSRVNPQRQKSRLDQLHRLAAANLASEGDVRPENAMASVQDSVFDPHPNTHVIAIEHESGRIAGTFSFTLDGPDGMPISRYFKPELEQLRQEGTLLNAWRFSMSPLFHSAMLRKRSFEYFWSQAGEFNVETVVLYFNERLLNFYKRKMIGEVIASRTISFDGTAELPVLLYACPLSINLANQPSQKGGTNSAFSMVV